VLRLEGVAIARIVQIAGFAAIAFAVGCDSDSGSGCAPLAASAFTRCDDPNECLSVTATWCFPGADSCGTADADLALVLPGGETVSHNNDSANGCSLDFDEQAEEPWDRNGDGEIGPFDENITCAPYAHASGPDRIDPGRYVARISESSFLVEPGEILVDINVDGATSCQIVTIPDQEPFQVSIDIDYP